MRPGTISTPLHGAVPSLFPIFWCDTALYWRHEHVGHYMSKLQPDYGFEVSSLAIRSSVHARTDFLPDFSWVSQLSSSPWVLS
jgi:hypothetical protein